MKIAKVILQKAVTEKNRRILIAVIDEDILGLENAPSIVEAQLYVLEPNIYNGMNPSMNLVVDNVKDRSDLKGLGIAGIVTQEEWYCQQIGKNLFEEHKP